MLGALWVCVIIDSGSTDSVRQIYQAQKPKRFTTT